MCFDVCLLPWLAHVKRVWPAPFPSARRFPSARSAGGRPFRGLGQLCSADGVHVAPLPRATRVSRGRRGDRRGGGEDQKVRPQRRRARVCVWPEAPGGARGARARAKEVGCVEGLGGWRGAGKGTRCVQERAILRAGLAALAVPVRRPRPRGVAATKAVTTARIRCGANLGPWRPVRWRAPCVASSRLGTRSRARRVAYGISRACASPTSSRALSRCFR